MKSASAPATLALLRGSGGSRSSSGALACTAAPSGPPPAASTALCSWTNWRSTTVFDGSNCKTQPGRAAFQGRFSQGCGERKRLRGKGCGAIWGHTAPQALSGGRPSPPRTAGPPLRSAPGTGAAAGASSQRRSLVQPAPPSAQPAPPPQPRRPAGRRQCASSWPGCRPVARACWPARCGRPSAGGGTTAAGRAAIARSPRVFWFSAMQCDWNTLVATMGTSPARLRSGPLSAAPTASPKPFG